MYVEIQTKHNGKICCNHICRSRVNDEQAKLLHVRLYFVGDLPPVSFSLDGSSINCDSLNGVHDV